MAKDLAQPGVTHPPSASNRLLIDFDDTIVPWGALMDPERVPFPGVAEILQALNSDGFDITIFTSRLSPTWYGRAGTNRREQMAYIHQILDAAGIPYNGMTAEKIPARAYFDDKAVAVEPGTLADVLINWRRTNEVR